VEQHASVQRPLHRIEYTTFGATMGSKSGEIRHNLRLAAKSHTGPCNTPPQSIILSLIGRERGNSFGRSAISRYSPYSQRACSAGRLTQLSIPLVSQGVASCNCLKSHIDKFFCERHTIGAAASQFAATPEFVERAASADRADEQAFKPVSHRITCLSIQSSGTSRKRHISPTR